MTDILKAIEIYKRREVATARAAVPLEAMLERAHAAAPPRGFVAAIEGKHRAGDIALIAEIKKASPSKGPDPRPTSIRRRSPSPTRPAAPPASRC